MESNADDRTASEPVDIPIPALVTARIIAVDIETFVANTFVTLIALAPLQAACHRN